MTTVAVIIPTHNRPQMLAFTLRSVLAQRGVDLAVTVVDDGTTDSHAVPAVIEALADARVHLVRHDAPRGVAAARNSGIGNTSSDWVAFCDDDDVWAPEKLHAQLTAARDDSAGWAYTGDVAIDGDLRVLNGAPPLPPAQLAIDLERYNPVPAGSSNVMVRRAVLDAVGCFDPTLLSVADWDLWVRLGRHGRPAWAPQPLVGCRVHGQTITRNRHLMLKEVDIVAARHQLPVDRARHFRWAAWNSMLDGQRVEAVGHYLRAIREGDLVSAGRAAVALVYPQIAHSSRPSPTDEWARTAQVWLDVLRENAFTGDNTTERRRREVLP
jgi:glycosyltransferase involved in cell wall biosynthesis